MDTRIDSFFIEGANCINCLRPIIQNLKNNPIDGYQVIDAQPETKSFPSSTKFTELSADATTKQIHIRVPNSLKQQEVIKWVMHNATKTNKTAIIQNTNINSHVATPNDNDSSKSTTESDASEQVVNRKLLQKIKTVFTYFKTHYRYHLLWATLGLIPGFGIMSIMLSVHLPLLGLIGVASIASILTIIIGYRSFKDAFYSLTQGRLFTMDTMFSLSTLIMLGMSLMSLFIPGLPMMFEAGLLIFGFRHLGLYLQESMNVKLSTPIKFMASIPDLHVSINDSLLIKAGDYIPCDGIALSKGSITEADINGSSLPRDILENDFLLQGMKAVTSMKMKVTALRENSTLARLDKAVESAQFNKAEIEKKSEAWLKYFIPSVFVLATLLGIGAGIFFTPIMGIQLFCLIIAAACPCTLGLIVPLAIKIGMNKCHDRKIHLQSAANLEIANSVDVIFFDYNGTLTEGRPTVTSIHPLGITQDELLSKMCALEQPISGQAYQHPFATAILVRATSIQPTQVSDLKVERNGRTGHIDNIPYFVGDEAYIKTQCPNLNLTTDLKQGVKIYLATNDTLLGYLIISDALKPEATDVVTTLARMGKEVVLCSGADKSTLGQAATYLGIRGFFANCQGNEGSNSKHAHIQSYQDLGHRVAMIGDAGNDAMSMVKSNFSIAIDSPSSHHVTKGLAGASLPHMSLWSIVDLFAISSQVMRNIYQNLLISLLYNAGAVVLSLILLATIGFIIPPGIGVALMVIQTGLILLNTYRFQQQPPRDSDSTYQLQ